MSRNAELLEAIINDETSDIIPQSRNESILKSIIDNTEYTEEPQSEIESLLLDLKSKISGGGELIEKNITANGTYTASDDNADGYSKVNVAVPSRDIANIDMKYINFRLDAGGVAHITPLGEYIETQTMADNISLNLQGANIIAAYGGAVKLVEINDPQGLARTIKGSTFADSGQNSQAHRMYIEMLGYTPLSSLRSNSVRTIEGGAFRYNFYIREVDCFYCNSIGENSFAYATALEIATLMGVAIVPQTAFRDCPNLATVQLGTLTSIGQSAFYNCPKLEEIPNLDSVESLGSSAFYGCAKIKEVDLSSIDATSVSSSRSQTFRNCTSLESIIFGDTPSMFNATNFLQGCTALKDITFNGTVMGIGTTFMANTGSDRQGTGLTVTFTQNTQAQIEALTNYPFGVPNATFIYSDS